MRFVVLDIETTGLNPNVNTILQIAMQEIDPRTLTEVGDMFVRDVHASPAALSRMVPYVREMHTKTGLLERVNAAESRSRVQRAAVEFLGEGDKVHAVGDSVHFDLGFLRVHTPDLFSRFSHRIVDVTSLYLACKSAGNEEFKGVNGNAHDAASDVRHSIEKLRYYRGAYEKGAVW